MPTTNTKQEIEILDPSSLNPKDISGALRGYLPEESLAVINGCKNREEAMALAYAELVKNGFTNPSSVLLAEGLINDEEVPESECPDLTGLTLKNQETPPEIPQEIADETNARVSAELNI